MDPTTAFERHDAGGNSRRIRPEGQSNKVHHGFHFGREVVKPDYVVLHLREVWSNVIGLFVLLDGQFHLPDRIKVAGNDLFVGTAGPTEQG